MPKVGAKLDIVGIEFGSWTTQLNLMLTGGPDSLDIFTSFWYAPLNQLYANGQVAPLDDLIASLNGRGGKHSNPDEKVTDIAKDVDKIRKSIDEARKELEKIRTSVKTAAEQRRCIYCRNPLSKDARFCPACGKSQTGPVSSSGTAAKNKICSLCRTSNPPDATTCKNCGKEL